MMTRKIALVNMCYPKDEIVHSPPLGILSIASFLELNGIRANIYDISIDISINDFTVDKISEYLGNIKEDIIGISTWDSVLIKIVLSVQKLKQTAKDKVIILGGPTATNLSKSILETFPCIDFCIEGEGEYPFLNLLNWFNLSRSDLNLLSNKVVGRKNNNIFRGNFKDEYLQESDIPNINYNLFDINRYNRFEVSSSRGCPYKCEFCSVNSTLDNKLRLRPIEQIIEELNILFETTKSNTANFVDDNFGVSKTRLKEFCNLFKTNFPNKQWTCYFRLNDLTEETVDMMADSGCIGTFIGIETGNKDKLNSLGKSIRLNDLFKRLSYATSKFDVTASFIWGFPDESELDLLDTFNVIEKITEYDNLLVDLYQLSPLSGTVLTNKIFKNLIFDEEAISGFIFPPHMPKFSVEEKNISSAK